VYGDGSDMQGQMMKYVALLRGIGPLNPNMRNEKLCHVFEGIGFRNVQTVMTSGNVLFEADTLDVKALEAAIERALPIQLGFTSTTIIRSRNQIQALVDINPFKGFEDSRSSHLDVTFLKNPPDAAVTLPYEPDDKTYRFLGVYEGAICIVTDLTSVTSGSVSGIEKHFGKEITTRAWKTVVRILKKLNASE
jgi:uncharacterized protein (DUF1697 family)